MFEWKVRSETWKDRIGIVIWVISPTLVLFPSLSVRGSSCSWAWANVTNAGEGLKVIDLDRWWVLFMKKYFSLRVSTHLYHLSQNVTFSHLLFGTVSLGRKHFMLLRGVECRKLVQFTNPTTKQIVNKCNIFLWNPKDLEKVRRYVMW